MQWLPRFDGAYLLAHGVGLALKPPCDGVRIAILGKAERYASCGMSGHPIERLISVHISIDLYVQ